MGKMPHLLIEVRVDVRGAGFDGGLDSLGGDLAQFRAPAQEGLELDSSGGGVQLAVAQKPSRRAGTYFSSYKVEIASVGGLRDTAAAATGRVSSLREIELVVQCPELR